MVNGHTGFLNVIDGILAPLHRQALSHANSLMPIWHGHAVPSLRQFTSTSLSNLFGQCGWCGPIACSYLRSLPCVLDGWYWLTVSNFTDVYHVIGQQTINVSWTIVPGAIGYDVYHDGFSVGGASPMFPGGATAGFSWTGANGGISQPFASGTGPTVMEAGGIHANKAYLSSSAGTGVATLDPTSITSNHTYTFPDSSGALLVGVTPTGNRVSVSRVYTNATTTPSNITGLSFRAVANTTYGMTCQIYYQGSVSTAGLDITITGPASPTSVFYSYDEHPTRSSVTTSVANAFATKLLGNAAVTATTSLHAIVTLGLVNGANAGTVQVQGSATGTGTVTVQPGSFCTL